MTVRTARTVRIATATVAAALGLVAISLPAFAEGTGPTPPPNPPTTIHVEAPKPPATPATPPTTHEAPPTTAKPSGGVEIVGYLRTLISKVEGANNITPDVKNALLARLRNARDSFINGQIVENGAMQALIADVRSALGAPPATDRREPTTAPPAEQPTGDKPAGSGDAGTTGDAGSGKGRGRSGNTGSPAANDKAGVIRLLDSAAEKVTGSKLSEADKTALLEQIAAVRAKVEAGTALGHEELGQLLTGVRKALAAAEHATSGSTEGDGDGHGKGTGTPKNRALGALDREIERVTKSDLPADVKAHVLAALNAAKDQLAAGSDAPDAAGDIRKTIEEHRAQRHAEVATKLNALADKVGQFIDRVAQQPGTEDAVATARTNLDKAKALLTADATPQDLRTAWQLLRQIRIDLKGVVHPDGTTTTTATPEPTTATPAS